MAACIRLPRRKFTVLHRGIIQDGKIELQNGGGEGVKSRKLTRPPSHVQRPSTERSLGDARTAMRSGLRGGKTKESRSWNEFSRMKSLKNGPSHESVMVPRCIKDEAQYDLCAEGRGWGVGWGGA